MPETTTTEHRCRYCGDMHADRSTMEQREIIQRDNRAPRGIKRSRIWFCKVKKCGGFYQMGCEG